MYLTLIIKYYRIIIIFLFLSLYIFIASVHLSAAKIYIWTDSKNRTHYCNDFDDVPNKYKSDIRIIDIPSSSKSTLKDTDEEYFNHIQRKYKAILRELHNYRKEGKSRNSNDYRLLKQEYYEIRKLYNNAKMKLRKKKR